MTLDPDFIDTIIAHTDEDYLDRKLQLKQDLASHGPEFDKLFKACADLMLNHEMAAYRLFKPVINDTDFKGSLKQFEDLESVVANYFDDATFALQFDVDGSLEQAYESSKAFRTKVGIPHRDPHLPLNHVSVVWTNDSHECPLHGNDFLEVVQFYAELSTFWQITMARKLLHQTFTEEYLPMRYVYPPYDRYPKPLLRLDEQYRAKYGV